MSREKTDSLLMEQLKRPATAGYLLYMKNIYLIKDLGHVTGYSIDTLKYYLKIGLIGEIGRGLETRFRFFDDTTVNRLNAIRDLRKEGYPIKQIKERLTK